MSLPQISNPNPITIPASAEKTFPDAYIVGLQLITLDMSGTKQRLLVTFRPYNQAANELSQSRSHDFSLNINDLWSETARAPLLAQVMGAIVNVVNLLVQERDLSGKLSSAGDTERPALEQQLSNVQAELGIQ